jgi:hypothetical protein
MQARLLPNKKLAGWNSEGQNHNRRKETTIATALELLCCGVLHLAQNLLPFNLIKSQVGGGLCSTALLLRHSCATRIVVVAVVCATTYYVGGAGGGGASQCAPVMRQ